MRTTQSVSSGTRLSLSSTAVIIAALFLGQLGTFGCGGEDPPSRNPGKDWMRKAKLAGMGVYHGIPDSELAGELDDMVAQHVDVVIGDSTLSGYKDEAQFQRELGLLSRVIGEAHKRGLKVVWYLTTLEVQTVDGKNRESTMAKDHPEWIQVGLNGKKNVFYGGQEDWVEASDESAWVCPVTPYREYFFERIKRLAQSGLDGIWADVPLFMDTGVKWNCHCSYHKEHFKKTTGKDLPTKEDWNDPVWREWIRYRHDNLNDFIVGIKDAARSVNPEFEVVAEIFTLDYNDAMDKGLDGSWTGNVEGLSKAWEIDSVSNGMGMALAVHDDWVNKVTLTKFARGADKGRPTWVFSYGAEEWDAQRVMSIAFAAQANPYETQTPNMANTVGSAFRKRMYKWADDHVDAIYDSRSAARVGLLYSSSSRDYLDHHYGFAMFSSVNPPVIDGTDLKTNQPYKGPDREWWSNETRDSVNQLEFLGEYRGFAKALVHLHEPFFIETMEKLALADLQKYETLIAPNVAALSDDQAQLLRQYVEQGGNLIVSGLDPFSLDQLGTRRSERALKDVVGFDAGGPPRDGLRSRHFGKGSVHVVNSLFGRRYLRADSQLSADTLRSLLDRTTSLALQTNAPKDVHLELYQSDSELLVHALSLASYTDAAAQAQQVQVTLALPPDEKAKRVWVSSPEAGFTDADVKADSATPGLVTFSMPVKEYTIARVELEAAQTHGSLEVTVSWPKNGGKGPRLGAVVRVAGAGLLRPRTAHLDWGTAKALFEGLPQGKKTVEVITVDDNYQPVGHLYRAVTIEPGKAAALAVANGISTGGPTQLDGQVSDSVFAVNDSGAAVKLQAGGVDQSLDAGKVATLPLTQSGSLAYILGPAVGAVSVVDDPIDAELSPSIENISHSKGFAGHSVIFTGKNFGTMPGKAMWGDKPCTVTHWDDQKVTAYLPSDAAPGTANLMIEVNGRKSNGEPFNVVPPDIQLDEVMTSSFNFVRDKLRSPEGGVHTNLKDRVDPPDAAAVYPYGHHMTAEHMGLILWVSAGLLQHKTFEESFQFVTKKMFSPRRDVINWAIHKTTGEPMVQREDEKSPWLNSNAPLDDFRVLKGFIAGWMQWQDERYLAAALRLGEGLYETSVSRRDDFPKYPNGLVAYAYNWPEEAGLGVTDIGVIPIDYADLWTMQWLAQYDARWVPVVADSIRLMEASQIPSSGQYYNAYLQDTKAFSGDFEFRDTIAGQKVKAIQSLWIGIHLARLSRKASAQKALDFYKQQYTERGRIAEYLNYDGSDVTEPYFASALINGEPRIYSQAARLAYYLGDKAFGDKVLAEKVVTDRDADKASVTYGNIGMSSTSVGDAEAWNNLESLIGLAIAKGSKVMNGVFPDPLAGK